MQIAQDEQRVILTFDWDYGELVFRYHLPLPIYPWQIKLHVGAQRSARIRSPGGNAIPVSFLGFNASHMRQ